MEFTQPYKLPDGAGAPPFSGLPGTDGKTYGLDDFADADVLVIAWWCNHCPYVQAWEERTIKLAREYANRGVRFIAINANDTRNYPTDDMAHMKERAAEKEYPFAYVRDDSQEVAQAYGATVTPHYQVFDRDRRLRYQGRLDDNKERPTEVKHQYVKTAIDAILEERAPEPRETPTLGCSVKWRA